MKTLWKKWKRLLSGATWGQRATGNFLLCAFGLVLIWGYMGYPLPAVEMEFRRLERTNLLPESEIIFDSEVDSPIQWRDLPELSFGNQIIIGVEGDRVHVAKVGFHGIASDPSDMEVYALREGITPVPMYYMVATERETGSSSSGVPLMFINAPEEAERAEIRIDSEGRNGGARWYDGEGWRFAPGRWIFCVAPGSGFYFDWYAGGVYTLHLYQADGSLLLEHSGTLER